MNDLEDDLNPVPQVEGEEEPENFFVDILTGKKESPSAKKLLVQKILHQLIESYGFARLDLDTNYNPQIESNRRRRIDIAIFRPAADHTNDNLQRVVVCKPQKKREKLRSTRASNSRLSTGVSSTVVEKRSPLSPNVPAWPVAIRRAFSFGLAPEPSETTTSGPS